MAGGGEQAEEQPSGRLESLGRTTKAGGGQAGKDTGQSRDEF